MDHLGAAADLLEPEFFHGRRGFQTRHQHPGGELDPALPEGGRQIGREFPGAQPALLPQEIGIDAGDPAAPGHQRRITLAGRRAGVPARHRVAAQEGVGLVQSLGPGQLRGGAGRRRGGRQGLTPQGQAHQGRGQGFLGPQPLEELGPPGVEGEERQGFPGGAAGRQGGEALPVPDLVRQPLVGHHHQGAGAGVLQQVILQGGAGGEEPGGGQPIAPGGEGRFRSCPWPGVLLWGEKGEKAKRRKGFWRFFVRRALPATPIRNFHRQIFGGTGVSPGLV